MRAIFSYFTLKLTWLNFTGAISIYPAMYLYFSGFETRGYVPDMPEITMMSTVAPSGGPEGIVNRTLDVLTSRIAAYSTVVVPTLMLTSNGLIPRPWIWTTFPPDAGPKSDTTRLRNGPN